MNIDQAAESMAATRQWCSTSEGDEFLRHMAQAVEPGPWKTSGLALILNFAIGLGAPLYWVSGEMADLIEHASMSLPDEPLCREELPNPNGFCLLERPVQMNGAGAVDGIVVGWCWSADGRMRSSGGVPYMISCPLILVPGRDLVLPFAADCYDFGDRPMAILMDELRGTDDPIRRQMLRTFWKISQQRLADRTPAIPSRSARRRMEKAGLPVPQIITVTLRRIQRPAHEPQGNIVDWTHRWIVSGFWRRQFMPKLGGHRVQWIDPYVKGPEDKPLVIKERRYALVR
jgi:hypothetical protein